MSPTNIDPTGPLARNITFEASKQTAWTIQALVPRSRRDDAFRAYAYFRWVDDVLDGQEIDQTERLSFLDSQMDLLHRCLNGKPPRVVGSEEWMLVELTQGPLRNDPGLRIYLQDMMAVMDFDANRRGRRITQHELHSYSRRLATAVSEAVYTFIGGACRAPRIPQRYLAADAAHIIHMLRDMHEDLEAGYINIPVEVLPGGQISVADLSQPHVRLWVRDRVEIAKSYFNQGEAYLSHVDNPRCRLAGALYTLRFQGVMQTIERDEYLLQPEYDYVDGLRGWLRILLGGASAMISAPSASIDEQKPIAFQLPERDSMSDLRLNVPVENWEEL